MKKRLLALVLVVTFVFTGCNYANPEGVSNQNDTSVTKEDTTQVKADEVTPTEEPKVEAPKTEAPKVEEPKAESEGDVYVSNAKDFVAAIRSNVTIHLAPKTYNITDTLTMSEYDYDDFHSMTEEYVGSSNEFDGYELEIVNVDNLTIVCDDDTKTAEIVCEPRYADVLHFIKCSNITLSNVVVGHTPDRGSCCGSVLAFEDCNDISLSYLDLYGCGTYGIEMYDSSNLECRMSKIHDCSYGLLDIVDSRNANFEDCTFAYDEGYAQVSCYESQVTFYDSIFMFDSQSQYSYYDDYLCFVSASENSLITFKGCKFDTTSYRSLCDYSKSNVYVME